MTEEEAIFVKGKSFSELRNSGEDLPTERLLVGNSWVLPAELADEYDKHFPPGPRRHKQATDKVFIYEMVPVHECRCQLVGLTIRHLGRTFDVLEKADVFQCNHHSYKERIKTSKCNRYDVIDGDGFSFVIDKVEESMSVQSGYFRTDDGNICHETTIAGNEQRSYEDWQGAQRGTHFPFVKFDRFWTVWNGYVEFRKRQIAELRNIG